MELMDGMLDAGNLCEFVGKVIEFTNEETKDKTLWEYWLFKDWKHSWAEFLQNRDDKTQAAPTQAESLEIAKESMRMLQSFTLPGGGAKDEDIQNPGRDRGGCSES